MKFRWIVFTMIPLIALGFFLFRSASVRPVEEGLSEQSSTHPAKPHHRSPPSVRAALPEKADADVEVASDEPRPEPDSRAPAARIPGREGVGPLKPYDFAGERLRRESFLRQHGGGEKFRQEGQEFERMRLIAVPSSEYDRSSGAAVAERMGYVFIPTSELAPLNRRSGSSEFPVVAQSASGLLGVVTGTLVVQLKDLSAVNAVARRHGLKLKYLDQDLQTAYFESADGAVTLEQLADGLREEVVVAEVRLEIVQSRKRF